MGQVSDLCSFGRPCVCVCVCVCVCAHARTRVWCCSLASESVWRSGEVGRGADGRRKAGVTLRQISRTLAKIINSNTLQKEGWDLSTDQDATFGWHHTDGQPCVPAGERGGLSGSRSKRQVPGAWTSPPSWPPKATEGEIESGQELEACICRPVVRTCMKRGTGTRVESTSRRGRERSLFS